MDLFMPAERVLYDRAYCLSDEAEKDYAFEVAEEHGVDVGEVLYSDELMKEVRDALDRDIDLYLDDEIANFDSMLRELKCGDDPEHPAEISVVAMGSVGRWDVPSRGLVAANSLRDLIDGKGSADALVDCQIDRIVDTNGTFSIEASHHDGTAYLDVRLISGVSFDGKGFRLGGERYAPGKMDLDDFHILLGNLYDVSDVGPCSLPHFAERAYGAAQESYRFGETVFDIYCETSGTDKPYKVMVSAGETVGKDAGTRFASAEEAKAWCYRYSMRELADEEKKPVPGKAASAAKKAAGCSAGDGTGDAGACLLLRRARFGTGAPDRCSPRRGRHDARPREGHAGAQRRASAWRRQASRRSRQGRERGGEPNCRFACGRGRRHQALGRRCLPANGLSLRDRLGGCRLCRRPPISLPRPRGLREMPSR